MKSQLPRLIFVLLVLLAAVYFSYYYPQLPEVVASHFNGQGAANGWQTKPAFFTVLISVSVLAAVVGFGVPSIIAALPPELINLPNKNYWLAPERATETMSYLKTHFAWLGCALYLVILVTFDYAVQSNLHPDHPPSASRLLLLLVGFTLFILVSSARMLRRFFRVPQGNV